MKTFKQAQLSFAVAAALCSLAATAETAIPEIEEIVTASRVPTVRRGSDAATTVITEEDIRHSPAQTVQELLAGQAGIAIRNGDGSSDAAVDLRGFGTVGYNNSLILINGVRQNDNDQAAARVSQIPLELIERIEIVRGGGSVQYGGGAIGGVINVITRSPFKSQPRLAVKAEGGTYDTGHYNAQVNLQGDAVALSVAADHRDTDNYRLNNAIHQRSLWTDLRLEGEQTRLSISAEGDRQWMGLPGLLDASVAAIDPRQTTTPRDNARRRGEQLAFNLEHDFGGTTLYVDGSQRVKELHTEFVSFGSTDDRHFETSSISPRLNTKVMQGQVHHEWTLGADWQDGSGHTANTFLGNSTVGQRQQAIFGEYRGGLQSGADWSLGLRRQRIDDRLVQTTSKEAVNHLTAAQLSGSVPLGLGWNLYGKLDRSFRVANVDDQALTLNGQLLRPQISRTTESGITWRNADWQTRAAIYRIDSTDEIHFNPVTFVNTNLEPTRRQGVELEARWQASPALRLTSNVTLQHAKFRKGAGLEGKEVPLVPGEMVNLSATWSVNEHTSLDVGARYVGQQRLDSDETNSSNYRLPSYTVVDIAVGQRWTDWSWRFTISNLFNEHYSEYGNSFGAPYSVLPSPGRRFLLSIGYQFK